MWILITALLILAIVAAVAGTLRYRHLQKLVEKGELEVVPEVVEADQECCGQHEVCEKESLPAAVSKQVEYYDDEELDRYRGTEADGYSEEAVEEFRDVLYTMQTDEVAGIGCAACNCAT